MGSSMSSQHELCAQHFNVLDIFAKGRIANERLSWMDSDSKKLYMTVVKIEWTQCHEPSPQVCNVWVTTLWYNIAIENGPVEIVDVPIKNGDVPLIFPYKMVIFQFAMLVYQRVYHSHIRIIRGFQWRHPIQASTGSKLILSSGSQTWKTPLALHDSTVPLRSKLVIRYHHVGHEIGMIGIRHLSAVLLLGWWN